MRARLDRSVSYRLHALPGEPVARYHLHVFTQPSRNYWGAVVYHLYDSATGRLIMLLAEPLQRRWHYRDGVQIGDQRYLRGCRSDCGGDAEWITRDRTGREVRRVGPYCSWIPWSNKQDLRCFHLGRKGRVEIGEIEVNATVYRSVR